MEYYRSHDLCCCSLNPGLPLPPGKAPDPDEPLIFLFERESASCRASFCVSDPRQLTAKAEDVRWLDPRRIEGPAPELSEDMTKRINARTLRAVNFRHPRWEEAARFSLPPAKRKRVHLLAVGDVGGTLLIGLKLLGGDCIRSIGICDLSEQAVDRWVAEMGQVSWPWDYDALPKVEAVREDRLFDCDVFLFAATSGVPPVGTAVEDVRMAQFSANRALIERFARKAREASFCGLFLVLSDPVDPLAKAAYLASNQGADGAFDGQGLLPEQIQGFGLGVMNARAADLARREPRYRAFLSEGRTFGPHGQGFVAANSVEHYDDVLSRELTERVLEANLKIRELGYKPYVAPALSSGALSLLLTLRGGWHLGSVFLGGVYFGVRNRWTPAGIETENLDLPDSLFARLQETESSLAAII